MTLHGSARTCLAGLLFVLGAHVPVPRICAQAPATPAGSFTAGPVYTGVDGLDAPRYPEIDVVLRNTAGRVPQASDLEVVPEGGTGRAASAVRRFDQTGYGIQSIMAIDSSGSMRGGPLAILRDSLFQFVSEARPEDKVGVLSFANDTRWEVPFDASRETLRDRLRKLTGRGTETHLYDALLEALDDFSATPVRRELIVISDGHDEGSHHTLDDVIAAARQRHIPVDAIGLTRSSPLYLQTLRRLAQATGGNFQQAQSDSDLQALVSSSIATMKAQPVATFNVKGVPRDGEEHSLSIRWIPFNAIADVSIPALAAEGWTGRLLDRLPGRRVLYALGAGVVLLLALGTWLLLRRKQRPVAEAASMPPPQPNKPPQVTGIASPVPVPHRSSESPGDAVRAEPAGISGVSQKPPPGSPSAGRTVIAGFFDPGADGVLGVLEVLEGPLAGQHIPVTSAQFWIGALPGNQLALAGDATLSGHHACLYFENRTWMVHDNASTNGTFLNGQRCTGRTPLHSGDELRMGQTTFRVARA